MSQIPTRLLILQRLQAHLEGISTANGSQFDLAGHVYRGRIILGQEVGDVALAIVEPPQSDMAPLFTRDNWKEARREGWKLLIQGIVKGDDAYPTDKAYELAAETELRLYRLIATDDATGDLTYPTEHMLGVKGVSGIEILPPLVRPPEPGISATAFFFMPLRITFATKLGQPYTTV